MEVDGCYRLLCEEGSAPGRSTETAGDAKQVRAFSFVAAHPWHGIFRHAHAHAHAMLAISPSQIRHGSLG